MLLYLQVIPAVCLFFDMIFNKIIIRYRQVYASLGYTALYVFLATRRDIPPYFENLNLKCKNNFSFLYKKFTDNNKHVILPGFRNVTCEENGNITSEIEGRDPFTWDMTYDTTDWACENIFQTYYCPTNYTYTYLEGTPQNYTFQVQKDLGLVEHDTFHNWGFTVIVIFTSVFFGFLISVTIHKLKSRGANPYDPFKTSNAGFKKSASFRTKQIRDKVDQNIGSRFKN